jgi:hypothetical protein
MLFCLDVFGNIIHSLNHDLAALAALAMIAAVAEIAAIETKRENYIGYF